MKKGVKKPVLIIALILISVVLVVAGVAIRKSKMQTQAAEVEAVPETVTEVEKKPVNVAVQILQSENAEETFTLPGTLEAWEDLTLSLEQPGPIVWIGPKEGDRLKAGDEILRIDKESLLSQHARNGTDYDVRKKQLERADSLLEEQLISERERDEVYQAFQSANTSLTETRIALERSTIISPIDGILERLLVDRGEYGNMGTPAAVIVKIDKLKVVVDVPEKDVPYTRTGQKVVVLPSGANGKGEVGRSGRIILVSYLANEKTRTYRTKVQIDNSDDFLRPGMIVRVKFVRQVLEDVIVVPLYAVIDKDGEKFVFVVEDGTAVRRQVRLGPILNGKVVVFGGIQVNEHLVTKGQQLVVDGGAVKVIEE
ncbi:MAG: efflux RND transporter periplasmic adaptor subunit [bacterium]|nr:efflux RND transporter periplasmic adaptor subunit [bacterium]